MADTEKDRLAVALVGVDVAGDCLDDLLDEGDQEEQVTARLEHARWCLARAHSSLRSAFEAAGGTEEDRRSQVQACAAAYLKETASKGFRALARIRAEAAFDDDSGDLSNA